MHPVDRLGPALALLVFGMGALFVFACLGRAAWDHARWRRRHWHSARRLDALREQVAVGDGLDALGRAVENAGRDS